MLQPSSRTVYTVTLNNMTDGTRDCLASCTSCDSSIPGRFQKSAVARQNSVQLWKQDLWDMQDAGCNEQ